MIFGWSSFLRIDISLMRFYGFFKSTFGIILTALNEWGGSIILALYTTP